VLPRSVDPFLLALAGTVALASVLPATGAVATAMGGVATGAIMLLFFLHGVRLPRENLKAALLHWRLHVLVLGITFAAFPLVGLALSWLAPGLLPPALWVGVLFLCALPSTVQSSIAFTSMAGGNVAATVASAAVSNLLGILLTPVILGLLVSVQGGAVSLSGVWKIVLQLLLPFALGHALRPWLGSWAVRQKAILTWTDRGTIVLAVYSAFSLAVVQGLWQQLPLATLLAVTAVTGVLLALALWGSWVAAGRLGFAPADQRTVLYCGGLKSLVSGVPMARVLFPGPEVGMAVLPVMIFHQLQLMVCAGLARRQGAAAAAGARNTEQ
jgi:sodium/bile acid cotransporter 7